jgi:hypothetical protein
MHGLIKPPIDTKKLKMSQMVLDFKGKPPEVPSSNNLGNYFASRLFLTMILQRKEYVSLGEHK